jgi:hypothetical protein
MKNKRFVTSFVALLLAPASTGWAASNKDRVGFGNRSNEQAYPQATETKQYCTEINAKVQPGKDKERSSDEVQQQSCQASQAVRPAEEARAELRKVERSPHN